MNGLTGKKMRANFEAIAPVGIQNDARNLVEFCCFRYLVRSGTEFHPGLKVRSLLNLFPVDARKFCGVVERVPLCKFWVG